MNHTSHLRPFFTQPSLAGPGAARKGLAWMVPALPALLALGGTGCYRATGFQRTTVVAEAVPETGGDRVGGLKSMAGPGDYYLGNDFVQVAIDGTRWGDTSQVPIAGAVSGGSIVDAGYLSLDTSYQRVNMPGDSMERLTPVVNQDPDLPIVFDTFEPDSLKEPATLTMKGHILDTSHKITGASWDSAGLVQGVTVTHVLALEKLSRYILLTTTIVNESGATLGIRTVGDYLKQTTGGYRFSVPAGITAYGETLDTPWGIQIPGSDWGSPIATAVQSPMVALMANEPGANALDSHASIGFMSQDAPTLIVTSDAQDALSEVRPLCPSSLAIGSLPVASVAAGAQLTFNRRMYILGGASTSSVAPNISSILYDQMALVKYNDTDGLWPQNFGQLEFSLSGSAMRQGPLPTEVRVERNAGGTVAKPTWIPERVVWLVPGENVSSTSSLQGDSATMYVPAGTYRIVVTNKLGQLVKTQATNYAKSDSSLLTGDIYVYPTQGFILGGTDYLCPEVASLLSDTGAMIRSIYSMHFFDTREADSPTGSLQPLRITIKGTGGSSDPWMRRTRTMGNYYDAITKKVAIASTPGQEQYRAGNEMFGSGFQTTIQSRYFWLPNGTVTSTISDSGNPVIDGGTYRAYGTRGPLSDLQYIDVTAYNGQSSNSHSFIVWPKTLPTGWVSFDVPGPSQATGGGFLPGEKLTSALAEAVNVVGHTEKDFGTDAGRLYNDYRTGFDGAGFLATQLTAVGSDPFVVGARSSVLSGYGTATSLFTPTATAYRFNGALQPDNWTMADFITQAKGKYVIAHRPRGSAGLFTLTGFDRTVALGTGANAWWTGTGFYANGATNGGFDAIELLRGEGFDKTAPDAWFQEFLEVRADWFALLNQQLPTKFTKALGLSSAKYSYDTPVGLARTYLKAAPVLTNPPTAGTTPTDDLVQDLSTVLTALQSGAAVASTGPFLDVKVGTTGPGGLVAGPATTANVVVKLYMTDWMPVDEVRIVLNGAVVTTVAASTLTQDTTDTRLYTGTFPVTLPTTGTGAWIVVEAGVPLAQTGVYKSGTSWYEIMRGIYPIAVTNPIFIDVTGTGYTHP